MLARGLQFAADDIVHVDSIRVVVRFSPKLILQESTRFRGSACSRCAALRASEREIRMVVKIQCARATIYTERDHLRCRG